jgi:hypothetical protein
MDALRRAGAPSIPILIGLSDAELATAAIACRTLASQESNGAREMKDATRGGPSEAAARRYSALAEKFEGARRRAVK